LLTFLLNCRVSYPTFPKKISLIQTDTLTRRLYAQDASMYEELPSGVSFPKSAEEIRELVKLSAEQGFTITARSAGTSLAGQTTGGGVIMDVSRHMTDITELNPDQKFARVQPGVIRDTLNREASGYKLQFGPDTATTNRCMLGGMIGNNSCGSFSIKHKTTREHILEIDAVLSDGSEAVFKALEPDELDEKLQLESLEGDIYRGMIQILSDHWKKIVRSYPHPDIIRRNTGYALDRLCEMDPIKPGGRPFNLAELLCGSEGTLAMTTSAKVRLVPLPTHKILFIPQFENLMDSLHAAVEAVQFEPAAVELVDDIILNATKGNIEQQKNRFFLDGDPGSILIIHFEGEDESELIEKASRLTSSLKKRDLGYAYPVLTGQDEMRRVWDLRKAGLGLLMGLGKDSRSPTFVEDTCVRVEDLPDYIAEFQQLLDLHETRCVFYAHASVGELHLRPVVDLSTTAGVETMKEIAHEVSVLVKKYNGSLSGEHGDGRARSPYIEKVLGPDMMPILRRVKELWDPDYRFNPGKIVAPEPIVNHLRFSPDYIKPDVPTLFKWRKEDGFDHALELCNGAGVCRKLAESGGTMCPSYHATREEEHSTRGRANLFRQLFSGKQADAFTDDDLQDALSLCLSCKACKSECPANVDMAKMKAEYLHGRHQKKGLLLSERFFGQPDKFYPLAAIFPSLTNKISKTSLFKRLLSSFAGVDSRRNLPQFAKKPFRKWFSAHKKQFQKGRKKVALLIDPFTNYHDPKVAIAACRVFDKLGFDIVLPDVKATGRPQISKGLLVKAKNLCEKNLDLLLPFVEKGIPIIGLEPSELLTLRDEYTDLCSDTRFEEATSIAKNAFLFEEFISSIFEETDSTPFDGKGKHVYLHGHCHTKALIGNDPLIKMLELAGFVPKDLETGCCGMAGSFGYEHYDVSMNVGEQVLFPKVRELPEDSLICAPGFSCKHQISDAMERTTLHPAEILNSGMDLNTDQPV